MPFAGTFVPLLAVSFCQLALAQEANGVVRGFDGQPVGGAVVFVANEPGPGRWSTEVLTDAEGRFAVQCVRPITAVRVQLEGVEKEVAVVGGNVKDAEVTFADATCFTIRGVLKAPDGTPLPMAELLCRDANGSALANVATDARGEYSVRLGAAVREIVVDPIGWQHVVAGPFDRDQTLDIDLRRAGDWFVLRGRVLDAGGPCSGLLVRAHLDATRVIRVGTRADGGYAVWTKLPIAKLEVRGPLHLRRNGPFTDTRTALDLDEREHGLVAVSGRVVADDGNPIAGALLFAVDRDGEPAMDPLPDGGTSSTGDFTTLVPRNTQFLFVRDQASGATGTARVTADRRAIEVRTGK